MKSKLIIAGGTGYLGKLAARYFSGQGWEVVILSRSASAQEPGLRYCLWNGQTTGSWVQELEGATVLLNLSGRTVDCRYTSTNKEEIMASRLHSTRCLAEALEQCPNPPKLWINASSATYYQHAYSPQDEYTGKSGSGFSVKVVQQWEKAFFEKPLPGIRRVALRLGIVLSPKGGAFVPLKCLAQMGINRLGPGTQYLSWLHEEDYLRVLQFVIDTPAAEGRVNVSAPQPLPNQRFMQLLQQELKLRLPLGVPLPKSLLEIGAWIIRTETELVLKSRCVVPQRLEEWGYRFRFPTATGALKALCNRKPISL